MATEIQTTLRIVRRELENDPRTRDNDRLLCSKIWWKQGAKDMDTETFFKRYAHTALFTDAESITRARRKVQEQIVELRGELYGKRKDHTTVIQKQLGYGKN